jgi:hypothetical protein
VSFIDDIFWCCSELLPVIHIPALTPYIVKHKSGYGPDVPGFYSRQTLFGAHPVSYSVGTGVIFAGVNGRGEKLTAHLHLLLWLRTSGAIPLLLPYHFLQCPRRSYEQCAFTHMMIENNARNFGIPAKQKTLFPLNALIDIYSQIQIVYAVSCCLR